MSGRVYNWVANIALLLGIASAFLYDSGKVSHLVAGAMGIIAGVTAVTLYFWNQYEISKKDCREIIQAPVEAEAQAAVAVVIAPPRMAARAMDLEFQRRILHEFWHSEANPEVIDGSREWMATYYAHHNFGRHLRYAFPKEMSVMTPEVELSPKEAAACAIEIVRNLAIEDKLDEWEYIFNAKGLRVSMKRQNAARRVPQEEFRFEGAEALR